MNRYKNLKDDIILEMKNNPKISILELSFNTDHHQSTIQKYVNELKAEGKVERIGGKYGGHWEIHDGEM